ncbi:hypothetical protein ACRDNQ_13030 [Palleronia sp. KMU-117]|uniref:hypothetical protein n=1 Tax=Palleronia sp. KMU-117 TaxID=3434108 RepID=UPI003D70AC95
MLTTVMILISLGFMAYLSHRWLGMTAEMQSSLRQKRMLEHLDWQNAAQPARRRLKRR